MSLDFYLTEMKPTEVFSGNITHNVSPMWREAGVFEALYESHGKLAKDIIDVLEKGVIAMESDPSRFEQHNPKNGWGSYESALPFLKTILSACLENPDAEIRISP